MRALQLIFLILSSSMPLQANQVAVQAIKFELSQAERIKQDAPLRDLMIDEHQIIWVVGRHAVWRYSVADKNLLRLNILADSSSEQLSHLALKQRGLFVASDQALYQLDFADKKLSRTIHPDATKEARSLGLVRGPKGLWWIHNQGIIEFSNDLPAGKIFHYKELEHAMSADIDFKTNTLWITELAKISTLGFPKNDQAAKIIHQGKDVFIDLKIDGDDVVVHSNYNVLRFDRLSKSLSQIIPVDGQKKLLAFDLGASVHSFLFNDHHLESYDLKSLSTAQAPLKLRSGTRILKVIHRHQITAVLGEEEFMVFDHSAPGVFNTATSINRKLPN
jgi:hypothetical protein